MCWDLRVWSVWGCEWVGGAGWGGVCVCVVILFITSHCSRAFQNLILRRHIESSTSLKFIFYIMLKALPSVRNRFRIQMKFTLAFFFFS